MQERLWRILGLVLVGAGVSWLAGRNSLCAQIGQVGPRPLYEILPEEVPDLHDKSIPYSFVVSDDFPPFILIPANTRPTAIKEENWYRVKKSLE